MDDDQVNLDEIADSQRRREAARIAGQTDAGHTSADAPHDRTAQEAAPKQWVKHVSKWLGAKRTLMQTRPVLTLRKKPAAL